MNRQNLLSLTQELGCDEPKIETRTYCPWCGEFTLILKEHKWCYKCLACERYGEISEVKQKFYGEIMEERKGVSL